MINKFKYQLLRENSVRDEIIQTVKRHLKATVPILSGQYDDQAVKEASDVVFNFVAILCRKKGSQDLLTRLSNTRLVKQGNKTLLQHSVEVAMLSSLIASNMNPSPKFIEVCLVGGFFHDVGLILNNIETGDNPTHAKIGPSIIETIDGIPQESNAVILQHHMRLDPRHMFKPTLVVSVADKFFEEENAEVFTDISLMLSA